MQLLIIIDDNSDRDGEDENDWLMITNYYCNDGDDY